MSLSKEKDGKRTVSDGQPRESSLDARRRTAATNAAHAEWAVARTYFSSLASVAFGAAEAGAQLYKIFVKCPICFARAEGLV